MYKRTFFFFETQVDSKEVFSRLAGCPIEPAAADGRAPPDAKKNLRPVVHVPKKKIEVTADDSR